MAAEASFPDLLAMAELAMLLSLTKREPPESQRSSEFSGQIPLRIVSQARSVLLSQAMMPNGREKLLREFGRLGLMLEIRWPDTQRKTSPW